MKKTFPGSADSGKVPGKIFTIAVGTVYNRRRYRMGHTATILEKKKITFFWADFTSNVKSTIFQDRKLPFCCFRSKKDRTWTFLNQNSGSKQNVFYQFSKFFDQMLLFYSISKNFFNYRNVLFCLWKTVAQFVTFCFDS
jgi:hypothetical protein